MLRRERIIRNARNLAILMAILLPLFALAMLCNPLLLAFLTKFDIVNEAGVDVWVTPIGMCEGSGRYGPLPMFHNRFPPAIPKLSRHDIPLESGESLTVIYDWDDINFRHVLVRTGSGDVLILDTDKKGNLHSCYGPQKDKYVIPSLADLSNAPPELVPCIEGRTVPYSGAVEY